MRSTFKDHLLGLQGTPKGYTWPKKRLKYSFKLHKNSMAHLVDLDEKNEKVHEGKG